MFTKSVLGCVWVSFMFIKGVLGEFRVQQECDGVCLGEFHVCQGRFWVSVMFIKGVFKRVPCSTGCFQVSVMLIEGFWVSFVFIKDVFK